MSDKGLQFNSNLLWTWLGGKMTVILATESLLPDGQLA